MDASSELYSFNTSKPMGEAVGNTSRSSNTSREMKSLSLEISKYPRDLLQLGTNPSSSSSSPTPRRWDEREPQLGLGKDEVDDHDDDDDSGDGDGDCDGGGINLGLGLSLGGKFGVDKSHKGLKRSSSIIGTMPLTMEDEMVARPPHAAVHALARTSSLPLETEEEWRKRKEIQTFRRMEAKRRRSEKQRTLKGTGGEEFQTFRKLGLGINNKYGGGSSMVDKDNPKGRRSTFGSLQGFLITEAQKGCSQGSVESQGGGSSSASELDSKAPHLGSVNRGEAISPASIQPSVRNEVMGCKLETTERCSGPQVENAAKQAEEITGNVKRRASGMEDMPCVFTIGDGPNGRKVEGILYKYGKGEEARIMCVCHGSFFSPAEFVSHAGGRDVDHPLRHIVVSPSPSALR